MDRTLDFGHFIWSFTHFRVELGSVFYAIYRRNILAVDKFHVRSGGRERCQWILFDSSFLYCLIDDSLCNINLYALNYPQERPKGHFLHQTGERNCFYIRPNHWRHYQYLLGSLGAELPRNDSSGATGTGYPDFLRYNQWKTVARSSWRSSSLGSIRFCCSSFDGHRSTLSEPEYYSKTCK